MADRSPQTQSLFEEALHDHQENRMEQAVRKLTKVIIMDAAFEDAYEALAVILYNQKRYDEAIACLQRWVKVNPNAVMAQTNLSRCYVAKNMILEAEKAQAEARRLGWKAELQAKKKAMPQIDFDAQIARFKKVIEMDPKDVLGYYSLGVAYRDSGRTREALETFEKAVEVSPDHSSSYLELGMILEGLGDRAKARSVFQKGMEVAGRRGDLMPQKKMEAHLRALMNAPQ